MLYIHIPFCKQACHYCDFHFSTNLGLKEKIVVAICEEIELRKSYLSSNFLETIYFGGGTPSLLSEENLTQIFKTIKANFQVSENTEITLEANPDDLNVESLEILKKVGINRLSIGVQSFDENHLKFMNRAHNSIEAYNCIANAQKAGFNNISVDLIYGIPSENHSILQKDLAIISEFDINHISAYCLTIEPKTTFGKWVKTNRMQAIDENFASEQFDILMNGLEKMGFEQYEISNFAKSKQYSKHNSSYWAGKQYLGIGPSAHSFDGESRQYNISNNNLYIKALEDNDLNFEKEILTLENKANEYLMTSLRTTWGTDLTKIQDLSNSKFLSQNSTVINEYLAKNWIIKHESTLKLTKEGKFFADLIASNLFID